MAVLPMYSKVPQKQISNSCHKSITISAWYLFLSVPLLLVVYFWPITYTEYIILMGNDGNIAGQGHFKELISSNTQFQDLMKIYHIYMKLILHHCFWHNNTAGGDGLKQEEEEEKIDEETKVQIELK